MKHIMLDLETLGTGSNAAIIAVGACAFNPYVQHHIWDTFYYQVYLASSIAAGLTMDPSTILWWMKQSDAARTQTFEGEVFPLRYVLARFTEFVENYGSDVAVWGNGAAFDNVVIRNAYKAVGLEAPWSFRNDKCYRTVVNLLPEDKRTPQFHPHGVAHNALDDAIGQALYLQSVFRELKLASLYGSAGG